MKDLSTNKCFTYRVKGESDSRECWKEELKRSNIWVSVQLEEYMLRTPEECTRWQPKAGPTPLTGDQSTQLEETDEREVGMSSTMQDKFMYYIIR
jgi:hypothetical protein